MLQSKLLRVLESQEIMRLGSTTTQTVDVRIIAATNRNLKQMVEEGTFREDLYYRLNVVPFTMPPLRERPEDILALANTHLLRCNQKYGLKRYFTPETNALFMGYHWPGNIRELKNVVERLAITSDSDDILLDDSAFIRPVVVPFHVDAHADALDEGPQITWKEHMERSEAEYLRHTIRQCGGNISQAAREMQIHRSALYKKIEKYNLDKELRS